MPLAGIGSRFIAVLVDTLIWFAGLFLLFLIFWAISPAMEAFSQVSYQWQVAIWVFVLFLFNWGYFTLFEAFNNGRTPGKRIARIRVIQRSGRPIGLFESMARNFIRYIDQIPFWTSSPDSPTRTFTAQLFSPPAPAPEPHTLVSLPAADVARLSSADLEVLEGFFSRRLDMALLTREALANRIAAAIRAKSGLEIPPGVSTETFLEAVGRQLRDLGRLR